MYLQTEFTKPSFYKGFLVRVGTLPFFSAQTKVLCWVLAFPPILVCCHVRSTLPSNLSKLAQTLFSAPVFSFDSGSESSSEPSVLSSSSLCIERWISTLEEVFFAILDLRWDLFC